MAPEVTDTERTMLSLPEELVRRVDEYRRRQEKIPPRAEVLRMAIEKGMDLLEEEK